MAESPIEIIMYLPCFEEGLCVTRKLETPLFWVSGGKNESTYINHHSPGLIYGRSTHKNDVSLLISYRLVIERKYIMFTLPIMNKITGNVYDSRTETIDMRFMQIADFALYCITNLLQIENLASGNVFHFNSDGNFALSY